MYKKDILKYINELIEEELGVPVTIESKLSDSKLDSLGTVMFLLALNDKYGIFKGREGDAAYDFINPSEITIKELVKLCI